MHYSMGRFNMKKEIKLLDNMFYIFLDGELIGEYSNMLEAQDTLEDAYCKAMDEKHKYKCDFCQEWYDEQDVLHRIEDRTFTAPYGSTFVLGGDVGSVAVCPVCSDDLEECR